MPSSPTARATRWRCSCPKARRRPRKSTASPRSNLTPTSAELSAQIDPKGAPSEYVFQYGTADCASDPSACSEVSRGSSRRALAIAASSVEVVGSLSPATAYFYRVIAKNAHGSAEGVAQPNTFTTLPSPGVLPDGRGWELVTPADKHGAAVEVARALSRRRDPGRRRGGGLVVARNRTGGQRTAGQPQLRTGPAALHARGARGGAPQSLETPHGRRAAACACPRRAEYHYFSPDLSTSLLQPTERRQFGGVVEQPRAARLSQRKNDVPARGRPAGRRAVHAARDRRERHRPNKFGGDTGIPRRDAATSATWSSNRRSA